MKFYFAAHTRKLDQYLPVYKKIINTLERVGWKQIDDWLKREVVAREGSKVDYNYYENLYNQTSKKIKSSDVLIAEISEKSTTVAQQIIYALENHIPVWCLYQDSHQGAIPAFTKTRKDKNLKLSAYKDDNLENIIQETLTKYRKREVKFNFYLTQDMNDYLEKKATKQKTPKSEIIRQLIQKEIEKNNE